MDNISLCQWVFTCLGQWVHSSTCSFLLTQAPLPETVKKVSALTHQIYMCTSLHKNPKTYRNCQRRSIKAYNVVFNVSCLVKSCYSSYQTLSIWPINNFGAPEFPRANEERNHHRTKVPFIPFIYYMYMQINM